MKKKLTIVMIILTIIEAVCMFVPGVFKEVHWVAEKGPAGGLYLVGSEGVNAFHHLSTLGEILCILTVVTIAVSIVSLILSFFEKKNFLTKFSAWLPFANFALFIVLSIYFCNFEEYCFYGTATDFLGYKYEYLQSRYELDVNWLFYIMIVLFVVVMFLSLVVKYAKFNDAPTKKVPVGQTSKADEIKKYKDLLDSGIITQEEFEAKKSELLK